MKIRNSVAFVTGANCELGLAITMELLTRGARKVYAAVCDPASIDLPDVVPVKVDVTDPASLKQAAEKCTDVNLLINNAGISIVTPSILDKTLADTTRHVFETNFYGLIYASQAFTPVIVSNGGGGIVNVLSDATWFVRPMASAYGASKAAAWSFTNALRHEIRERGLDVDVLALHVGLLDVDMTEGHDTKKVDSRDVAARTLAALELGHDEILGDAHTLKIKLSLSLGQPLYLTPRRTAK